jgi:hypothetical protein
MGYPVWRTKTGDLGKISAQQFYNLVLIADDPDHNGDIEYKLVAGQLPKGLQISPNGYISGNPEAVYTLQGVPFSTNIDVDSKFTVRATNTYDNKITDRTFNITVTGNFKPTILTVADPLGTFLDGTEVNLQLDAVDLNNDTLEWKVISGNLPPGLTLNSNGLLSGILEPVVYSFSDDLVGLNNSKWNSISWEFNTIGNKQSYNFTVSVNDTKAASLRSYRIDVFAFNDVRADTISITTDSFRITTDVIPVRPTILKTKTLGDFAVVNSGGYYAFKFDAVNYDITEITYEISTALGLGWDDDSVHWDMSIWDKADLALPPGLDLDPKTGWITGYIPTQAETTKDYTFGISVYSNHDETTKSPIRLFVLTVLGDLDLAVDWLTPADLGSVYVGATSNLYVKAVAASGRDLTYSLKNGSKLPQGLKLLNDGTVSGRISFQAMGFDQGNTTFDKTLAAQFVYSNNTNFDNVYKFTVIANDFANLISGEKTFTVRLNTATYEPYENLYIKCLPSSDKRLALAQIVNNTDIIDPVDVYRPLDPYFGVPNEVRFLVNYGIKASEMGHKTCYALSVTRLDNIATLTTTTSHDLSIGDLITVNITQGDSSFNTLSRIVGIPSVTTITYENTGPDVDVIIDDPTSKLTGTITKMNTYIQAMADRHFKKKFYFGDYKVAQGKDVNGNVLYDVLYVEMIEETKIYYDDKGVVRNKIPSAFTNINNKKATWRNPRATTLPQNQLTSDITRVDNQTTYIKTNDSFFPFEPLNTIAPNDLTLMQKDIAMSLENTYLNSLPEWMVSVQSNGKIIGYIAGAPLAYLKPGAGAKTLFNLKKYAPSDIKNIPFIADRYILDNSYSKNFDLKSRRFSLHKYTTFNVTSKVGIPITPVFNVDFAVDRPFDTINRQSLDYIIQTSGLDGITYNLDAKYLIFATQEAFTGWGNLANDGWNFYTNSIVPGYQEKLNIPTLKNQRAAVWQIKIGANNIVELVFIKEITTGDYVYVNEGATHGNGYLLYDITALTQGYTVPKYTQTYSQVYSFSSPTTFDKKSTQFINNVDTYTIPLQGDKYLQFPKIGVFTNGQ